MAYSPETLANLTTALSGNIDLYNEIISTEQSHDEVLKTKTSECETLNDKLKAEAERSDSYLKQISNLLSRIPVGSTTQTKSLDEKINDIKNTSWSK